MLNQNVVIDEKDFIQSYSRNYENLLLLRYQCQEMFFLLQLVVCPC